MISRLSPDMYIFILPSIIKLQRYVGNRSQLESKLTILAVRLVP
jgi:hypothetical protein